MNILDPHVAVKADAEALRVGATELAGADAVGKHYTERARGAVMAWLDGAPGAVWAPGGRPKVALRFHVRGGRITGIQLVADPQVLQRRDLIITESSPAP